MSAGHTENLSKMAITKISPQLYLAKVGQITGFSNFFPVQILLVSIQ
jgi:hypothetical protein